MTKPKHFPWCKYIAWHTIDLQQTMDVCAMLMDIIMSIEFLTSWDVNWKNFLTQGIGYTDENDILKYLNFNIHLILVCKCLYFITFSGMAICSQNMVVSPSLDGKFCLKCDVDLCFLSMITLFLNAFEKKRKKRKRKRKINGGERFIDVFNLFLILIACHHCNCCCSALLFFCSKQLSNHYF